MHAVDEGEQSQVAPPATPHAWYTLAVLILIYTCHGIDRGVVNIVLEPVKHEFKVSDTRLGLLSGLVFGLTYAIAGLPLGFLIDRINRKKLLAGMIAVWSSLTVMAGFAQSFTQLLVARMLLGAAESGAHPASMSMIGDSFPARQRSSAVSLFLLSTAIGSAVVFILGSQVVSHWGWRAAFLVAGPPGLLLAILLLLTVREPGRGATEAQRGGVAATSPPGPAETLKYALKTPGYLHAFMGVMVHSGLASSFAVWTISLLVRVHGLSLSQAGLFLGLASIVCGLLGNGLWGFVVDHLAKRNLLWQAWFPAITGVMSTAFALLTALAPNVGVAMAGVLGFDLFVRGYMGAGYGMAISTMRPGMRGLSMSGVQVVTNLVAVGGAPFLVGYLSDLYGGSNSLQPALATIALLGLWAAAHFALASRTLKQDLARAAAS